MKARGFTLFDTAIGTCGIAWSDAGIVGVLLPERSAEAARKRMQTRHPGAPESLPPGDVQRAIDAIRVLLGGKACDLGDLPLDLDQVGPFERSVYDIARDIPHGRTLTYGEVAARLGDPTLARDVGQALGRNPVPVIVPCHRVVASGGRLGGFSAPGGVSTKRRMLAIEQAVPDGEPDLFASPPAG
jgi:methylated-DNA-[protein]-cysteine S-methyltransferase